jgi:hypothetical protein
METMVNRIFSAQIIRRIDESLPDPVCDRRRKLLPQILREWSCIELQKHLSLDSRQTIHARIRRLEQIKKSATDLLNALKAADDERGLIVFEMLGRAENPSRAEWAAMDERLQDENYFLAKLAAIAPGEIWKLRRGQPRNFAAHLVLSDAASIFRWFTHQKPKREVDRIKSTEIGAFFRFASVLWPLVFGKGIHGLPATMKNWEHAGSPYSPLIANINLRHPTWRVYEC